MLRPILRNAGIAPSRLWSVLSGWRRYAAERAEFRRLAGEGGMPWGRETPMLTEWNESSGGLGGYFFQDLTVARWIYEANPIRHVDVGSRIDGFIGHLTVFREVEVLDIRPQPLRVPNVCFHRLDLMADLSDEWIGCTDSLSCLHTIEHFGLGRYGDALDPDGHLKGLAQLKRMVKTGGVFYLSTPVGHERVEFNANRVFAPTTVLGWFADGWQIEKSAVVDDVNQLHESAEDVIVRDFRGNLGVGIVAARKMG